MKRKRMRKSAGSTLIEVVVAIAILGIVTVPVCQSLVMAHEINSRTDELMAQQLLVTGKVEELMANGVSLGVEYSTDNVTVNVAKDDGSAAYRVTVSTADVSVETYIRPAQTESGAGS